MSRAVNEFLHGVSRTFQDAALPSRSPASPAGNAGQSFGDLFGSVSAGSLNLSGPVSAGYPDAPDTGAKAAPKKRSPRSKRQSPSDMEDGDIREL
jgi:hypothetical protein